MKTRDRYLKVVAWSEEDQCYIGSVPGWIEACCHGKNEADVYRKLCEILDEWIAIYRKDGWPLPRPTNKAYSGKFVLRTGREMHRALAVKAMNEGDSLNAFVVKTLKKSCLGRD
jgi:predicted HicB family RNase H-like nuclease